MHRSFWPGFQLIARALLLIAPLAASVAVAEEPRDWAGKNLDDLVALYRQFHASPELSF